MLPDDLGLARRDRLRSSRLMGLFEPARAGTEDTALQRLDQALPYLDVLQVRIKRDGRTSGPSDAAPLLAWTERVLERVRQLPQDSRPLVLVNDRPDVVQALQDVDGVHLGQDDAPPEAIREFLGPDRLIGLSTHDLRQVAEAQTRPVDYLGFGPVFQSRTKGYTNGLGAERALCAARASSLPVFPIGGIDHTAAIELIELGRAAVSSVLFESEDPGGSARELGELLASEPLL